MKLEGLQKEIFLKRYAMSDETEWDQCAKRVAHNIARAENDDKMKYWEDQFFDVINDGYFMPGGRILRNAGRKRQSMINCFISELNDEANSIGDFLKTTYMVGIYEGGFGYIANVRPLGAPIAGVNYAAPGVVNTVTCIDDIGKHTRSGGGRRGAIWSGLRVSHPDMIYWLDAKKNPNVLNNHNISVIINNDFIKAAEDDKDWTFTWNNKSWQIYELARNGDQETIDVAAPDEEYAVEIANHFFKKDFKDQFTLLKKKKIKAKDIWQKMIDNASHNSGGEPGIINESLIEENFTASYYTHWIGMNGCQPRWATILTPNGISTLDKVNIGDMIWSGSKWTKIINKWSTGTKAVYAYRTTAGTFYGTENHQLISDGNRTLASDAESIDSCVGDFQTTEFKIDAQDVIDGLVIGDGSVHKASNNLVYLIVGQKDHDYYDSEITALLKERRHGLDSGKTDQSWEIMTTISYHELPKTYDRIVPDRFRFGDANKIKGFLRGLFSANGSISGSRVTLRASSFAIIEQVQEMLSAIGIRSYFTTNKAKDIEWHNGVYTSKESYDVNISVDRHKFLSEIGFIQKYKMDQLSKLCEEIGISKYAFNLGQSKKTFNIIEKEFISEEEVFDITVDSGEHTYWTGGMLVSNCTEVTAGGPHDVCCLGHLNLSALYDEKTNDINYKLMQHVIHTAVRFLDNVLTLNDYPLPEIKVAAQRGRRIGLGFMGFAHLLIKMGIRYGSDKCINFMNRFMATMRNETYKASINLAKERGVFPAFNATEHVKNHFIKHLPANIKRDIEKHGLRNVAMLLLAPTGTISIVHNTSSSLEPIFAPAYRRKYRKGETIYEETVVDPLFEKFLKDGKVPSYFVGAYDITVEEHLRVLSTAQTYLDQAISKTSNIPKDFEDKNLAQLVLQYVPYIKTLTLYRENSRKDEPLTPIKIDSQEFKDYVTRAESQECLTGVCEI